MAAARVQFERVMDLTVLMIWSMSNALCCCGTVGACVDQTEAMDGMLMITARVHICQTVAVRAVLRHTTIASAHPLTYKVVDRA